MAFSTEKYPRDHSDKSLHHFPDCLRRLVRNPVCELIILDRRRKRPKLLLGKIVAKIQILKP